MLLPDAVVVNLFDDKKIFSFRFISFHFVENTFCIFVLCKFCWKQNEEYEIVSLWCYAEYWTENLKYRNYNQKFQYFWNEKCFIRSFPPFLIPFSSPLFCCFFIYFFLFWNISRLPVRVIVVSWSTWHFVRAVSDADGLFLCILSTRNILTLYFCFLLFFCRLLTLRWRLSQQFQCNFFYGVPVQ